MVPKPEKTVPVGLNYRDHGWPNTLIPKGEEIGLPPIARTVDYEGDSES